MTEKDIKQLIIVSLRKYGDKGCEKKSLYEDINYPGLAFDDFSEILNSMQQTPAIITMKADIIYLRPETPVPMAENENKGRKIASGQDPIKIAPNKKM